MNDLFEKLERELDAKRGDGELQIYSAAQGVLQAARAYYLHKNSEAFRNDPDAEIVEIEQELEDAIDNYNSIGIMFSRKAA